MYTFYRGTTSTLQIPLSVADGTTLIDANIKAVIKDSYAADALVIATWEVAVSDIDYSDVSADALSPNALLTLVLSPAESLKLVSGRRYVTDIGLVLDSDTIYPLLADSNIFVKPMASIPEAEVV